MISGGHQLAEIKRYTIKQCQLYLAAIDKQRRASLRDSLMVARGAQADAKGFKTLLKEIDGHG